MQPHTEIRLALTLIALWLGTQAVSAQSQQVESAAWIDMAQPRLKAIYEDHEFRPEALSTEWLPDSSGYLVEEIDRNSKEAAVTLVAVETGNRSIVEDRERLLPNRDPRRSPDGQKRIESRNGNLWVVDVLGEAEQRLTRRFFTGDIDYRNVSWSPDGERVLFVESDSADVKFRQALVPDDPSYPSVRRSRFARVAEKIPALRVGVAKADGSELIWLPIEVAEEGCYFGHVGWATNSEEVIVERRSRFRDQRDFLLATLDGAVKTLFSETNDAWAVGSQGLNAWIDWIDQGQAFLFISEQDGWHHAYRCSRDGQRLTLLTPGNFDIIQGSEVDEQGGWFYFYASPENATQQYLYRVPLDGTGTLQRITPANMRGTHEYKFSPDCQWALHTYSTIDTPPVVELVEVEGHRVLRTVQDNHQLRTRVQALVAEPTEFLQLEIAAGVTLDAWMIKPRDFDAAQKYPVLVYVYGEPYAQTVLDRWGASQIDFHRVVADLGYLVVSIDNRGTPAPKGAAWRRTVFGSLGPLSTEDQAAALKVLGASRDYVDLSRVAIWGWSGGGSNTLNALFRKPELYHVGIAVVPKPQPQLYNAWFQEIYMRTPAVNPDGYQRSAPIGFAEGLQGKLLIITGSGETNTHIQIIEGLVDRLIELGKSFDYMVYPNRDHGLREGRGTELHVRMLIIRYLHEHLPPGPR